MKLATKAGGPDGTLLVVSRDLARAVSAGAIAATLQQALERWDETAPALLRLYAALNDGEAADAFALDMAALAAPLPRAWQWLDGSAFPTHGMLMQRAYGLPPIETAMPLMYQGLSHQFLGPHEDVVLPDTAHGIDFEGEFAIVTDAVPMGVSAAEAARHIKLVLLLNDWSLRVLAGPEMKTGFGWVQAKPACAAAPIALTPDELGNAWRERRVQATLAVDRGGAAFGRVPATEMAFGFDELVAHAARTRSLCAGTIIGSGTVSSARYEEVGSACISERQAIELIAHGEKRTAFLDFGERVRIEAWGEDGRSLFGAIDQRVVKG